MNRHPSGYQVADEDKTAGDEDPNPLLARAPGPDPWQPYTCARCGDNDRAGMPETCTACGMRNYG